MDYGADLGLLEKKDSATPLHFAAANSSMLVAEILIDAGAYVNDADKNGWTPLHYVVRSETGKLTVLRVMLSSTHVPSNPLYSCSIYWKPVPIRLLETKKEPLLCTMQLIQTGHLLPK